MNSSITLNHHHSPFLSTTRYHRRTSTAIRMSLREDGPSLAIVGVTGAVGQEFLSVISDRNFPYSSIKMLASKRSSGKQLTFEDRNYIIEELTDESFNGVDIALFSAGGSISKRFGPVAVEKGSIVVDNSSAFRMVDGVPLVIPEVNPEAIKDVRVGNGKGALIANPNCSTIICLMAATPLHHHAKVTRMVVSTYQAASGAGAAAMEELEQQTREVLEGKRPTCNIFKQQYAFNLFSHNAPILSIGYNEEEMKLIKETRKIWNDNNVRVTATCIRVPVMRAHAESVNLQFEQPITEDMARDILKNAPGVVVIDDRSSNHFPTPLEVSNQTLKMKLSHSHTERHPSVLCFLAHVKRHILLGPRLKIGVSARFSASVFTIARSSHIPRVINISMVHESMGIESIRIADSASTKFIRLSRSSFCNFKRYHEQDPFEFSS